jgi:hypothetical protein
VVATWHELAVPAFVYLSWARYPEPQNAAARRVLGRRLSEVLAAVPRPAAESPVPVMLVAAQDQRDVIALDALAAALAERGVASRHFGATRRAEMLADAVARTRPTVVVVWGRAWSDTSPIVMGAVSAPSPYRPMVVAGGQGWPENYPEGQDVLRCPTLAEAVEAVISLLGSAD